MYVCSSELYKVLQKDLLLTPFFKKNIDNKISLKESLKKALILKSWSENWPGNWNLKLHFYKVEPEWKCYSKLFANQR